MITSEPAVSQTAGAGGAAQDVGTLLDHSKWSRYQKLVLALTALAVLFDGLDNQLLGFAAPALIRDWGLQKSDLVPIIALSLVAMTIGTALIGLVGDRIGRRPSLIGCMLLFGSASSAMAFAPNLTTLMVLRLIAALGLGGAMPIATALLAEFTPLRHRAFAVTLGIVCVPLGGLVGGLIAATILPSMGWRALFFMGGVPPLLAALIFLFLLPESPRFLLARTRDEARVTALLARCGIRVDGPLLTPSVQKEPGNPVRLSTLFAGGLARDTILLWMTFFSCLLAVYTMFNWAPTLLAAQGLDLRVASTGLSAFNLGGVAGAVLAGAVIDRAGSRRPMLLMAGLAGTIALGGAAFPLNAATPVLVIAALFGVLGFLINGLQTTLFALAANLYPTEIRSSGVGFALGIGRLGAVMSSPVGSMAIAWGVSAYFLLLSGAMLGASFCLGLIRRHLGTKA